MAAGEIGSLMYGGRSCLLRAAAGRFSTSRDPEPPAGVIYADVGCWVR